MDGRKRRLSASCRAMARVPTGKDSPQAIRLRVLREAYGSPNAAHFAAQMRIEYKRWNNFENGHPLSKDAALALVKKIPGLTLDWLFLGRTEGLTNQLARLLEEKSGDIKRSA